MMPKSTKFVLLHGPADLVEEMDVLSSRNHLNRTEYIIMAIQSMLDFVDRYAELGQDPADDTPIPGDERGKSREARVAPPRTDTDIWASLRDAEEGEDEMCLVAAEDGCDDDEAAGMSPLRPSTKQEPGEPDRSGKDLPLVD